jgi:hypothetical protein
MQQCRLLFIDNTDSKLIEDIWVPLLTNMGDFLGSYDVKPVFMDRNDHLKIKLRHLTSHVSKTKPCLMIVDGSNVTVFDKEYDLLVIRQWLIDNIEPHFEDSKQCDRWVYDIDQIQTENKKCCIIS